MTPTGPAPTVTAHPSGTEGITVLRVTGEVDLATIPMLVAGLDQVVTRGCRAAIIDVSAMSFCSMRGLAALAGAAERARTTSIGFVLLGLSPHLARLCRISGLALLASTPTSAARIEQRTENRRRSERSSARPFGHSTCTDPVPPRHRGGGCSR